MDEPKDSKEELTKEEKDRIRREEFEKRVASERAEREKSKGGRQIYKYGAVALGVIIVIGAAYAFLPSIIGSPSSGGTITNSPDTGSGSSSGGYLVAAGAPIGEIYCESMEGQAMHIHSELQVYIDGEQVSIPPTIGQTSSCLYWLHTHTPDGVIHVESPMVRTFILGQFLDVWGKKLFNEGDQIKTFVDKQDGKGFQEYSGNYRDVVLTSHEVIAIGTGNFTPEPFTFDSGL